MATAEQIISDWMTADEEKENFYSTHKGLVLRWLNEAQLRYADKSEMLRGIWTPTLTNGSVALPSDFIREFEDRVKKSATEYVALMKIDYQDGNLINWGSAELCYSIYNGYLYCWGGVGSPVIPYIKKPSTLSISSTIELPTQYHSNLIIYLDAMYLKQTKDYQGYTVLLGQFDNNAEEEGSKERKRIEGKKSMRVSVL